MITIGVLALSFMALAPQESIPSLEQQHPWIRVLDELEVYGDLRLRQESDFRRPSMKRRSRQRVRLRLGANYQLSDEVLLGTRLVTGDPNDPNSPHSTFGDVFNDLAFSLDRVFLTYRPSSSEGSFVTAGKFNHPFYRNPVYGELVWDADVQPEGILAGTSIPNSFGFEALRVTVGTYSILEQGNAADSQMIVGELRGRHRLGKRTSATLATSYYYYGATTPGGSTAILGDNAGNATVDTNGDLAPDRFASQFGIWDTTLGIQTKVLDIPVAFSAEYIANTRANNGQDRGWATGVSVGSTAKRGNLRAYYQWQVIEQDSVFSPFVQDDFLFATNHRSHVIGANLQLTDKIGLNFWTLVSAPDKSFGNSNAEQWRFRIDLNAKF